MPSPPRSRPPNAMPPRPALRPREACGGGGHGLTDRPERAQDSGSLGLTVGMIRCFLAASAARSAVRNWFGDTASPPRRAWHCPRGCIRDAASRLGACNCLDRILAAAHGGDPGVGMVDVPNL